MSEGCAQKVIVAPAIILHVVTKVVFSILIFFSETTIDGASYYAIILMQDSYHILLQLITNNSYDILDLVCLNQNSEKEHRACRLEN